jgi:hypothetical protein
VKRGKQGEQIAKRVLCNQGMSVEGLTHRIAVPGLVVDMGLQLLSTLAGRRRLFAIFARRRSIIEKSLASASSSGAEACHAEVRK